MSAKRSIVVSRSETNVSPFKTGTWRRVDPSYEPRLSPCTDLCPCSENIPSWMKLVSEGRMADAYQELIKENPFPLICGRVCYRFCEARCNRAEKDDTVSINAVERFLGEFAAKQGLKPVFTPTDTAKGRNIAIVGGGPAGLSAAHWLLKAGASVTIYDNNPELGGLLRYGIPKYRLPKDLLAHEIKTVVLDLGAKVEHTNNVDRRLFGELLERNDFVILGIGHHKAKALIGGDKREFPFMNGLHFLELVANNAYGSVAHIKRFGVIGGGNTAIDVARSAVRLGARNVTVIYRRTEEDMPAHKDEVAAAKKEGVLFEFLASPHSVEHKSNVGWTLKCARQEVTGIGKDGRKSVTAIEGNMFTDDYTTIVTAIGDDADSAFLGDHNWHFDSEDDIADGKVLLAGDALYGARSVSEAIASGKKAARAILATLGAHRSERTQQVVGKSEIKFHFLRTARKDPRILNERMLSEAEFRAFEETTRTISGELAQNEAGRCINCGTCIACDRCLDFCPDYSITKNADGVYAIDPEMCKGCGLCASVCERGVIVFGKGAEDVHQ